MDSIKYNNAINKDGEEKALCNSCGLWNDPDIGVTINFNKNEGWSDLFHHTLPLPINICSSACLLNWIKWIRDVHRDF